MKSDVRKVNIAAPLPASTAFDSTSTTAAFPLSHMAARRCVVTMVPSVGIGRWSITSWPPWTIIAQGNVPMACQTSSSNCPRTTAIVGRARCSTPMLFSVT
ncbi:MAG TPA: hypothetical protein VJ456_04135 [Acidimicrobiia bacterium]|nr:hypothetical protein [Acidimicrobiia bacterium]